MNIRRISSLGLNATVAGLLCVGSAYAGDTATVTIGGIIADTCKFTINTATITFTLDQTVSSNATGDIPTQPRFWCTKSATYTIGDNTGLNAVGNVFYMKSTTVATDTIPYSFTYNPTGTGLGKTSPIDMNIAASVANSAYVDMPKGTYADTVTLTISP